MRPPTPLPLSRRVTSIPPWMSSATAVRPAMPAPMIKALLHSVSVSLTISPLLSLSVDTLARTYVGDHYHLIGVIDVIKNSVSAHSDAPGTTQLTTKFPKYPTAEARRANSEWL